MYPTIIESLKTWATSQPNKKVWTFLGDREEVVDSFTYKVINDTLMIYCTSSIIYYLLYVYI